METALDSTKEAMKTLIISSVRVFALVTDYSAGMILKFLLSTHKSSFPNFAYGIVRRKSFIKEELVAENSRIISQNELSLDQNNLVRLYDEIKGFSSTHTLPILKSAESLDFTRRGSFEWDDVEISSSNHLKPFEFVPKIMEGRLNQNAETGLVEDIELSTLNLVDFGFTSLKALLSFPSFIKADYEHFKLTESMNFLERSLVSVLNSTNRVRSEIYRSLPKQKFVDLSRVVLFASVERIATDHGFLYNSYVVQTRDGYLLQLERIRSPRSKGFLNKVLYFQHGIMDSSFTWCCNGPNSSLAFLAASQDFDVFLGNFRGAYGKKDHINSDISETDFYNFSINEHGFEDVPSLIAKISEIKEGEYREANRLSTSTGDLKTELPFKLIACAHSLGGAALIMHTVQSRLKGQNHMLDALLLVTPAGILKNLPFFTTVGALFLDVTLVKWLNCLGITNENLSRLIVKLVRDLKTSLPNGELLVSLILLILLGGNDQEPYHGPFSTVEQLVHNFSVCGTSTKVFVHLRQHIQTGKFQGYDYSSGSCHRHFTDSTSLSSNMSTYGSATPLIFTDHYDKIDIPVKLVAGAKDRLIHVGDVSEHFQFMRSAGVDVSMEVFDGCGHADFTCGLSPKALNGLMRSIRELS